MSEHEKSRPACANCARRKTKCDRNSPCSSCVASKFQCRYVQKRPEKKRRVLHSTRYEESLTNIRQQLDALSSTLQSVVEKDGLSSARRSSNDGSNSTPSSINLAGESSHGKQGPTVTTQGDYEGESSFYSQSRRMAETLSHAISSAPNQTSDAQSAVVQSLIHDARTADSPTHEAKWSQTASPAFSQCPELAGLTLPPSDAVLRILAFAKTIPQRYFDYPFADQDEFPDLCQKLYFPTQNYTIFLWINVNCGLLYLFRDLEASHYDKLLLTKTQIKSIVSVCSSNIDQATKSLRLCIDPSQEALTALVTAGAIHMELAEGSMAWRLISAAAKMSIDLGYHRLPPGYGNRARSKKRQLFWYIYAMEKSLAFNFGRGSTLQDYDVTTERPILNEDLESPWYLIVDGYIDFALIQYEIYVKLFSAKALQEPPEVRVQRVHTFAATLADMKERFAGLLVQRDMYYGTQICFLSVLTLIYRVLPLEDSSIPSNHSTQPSTEPNQNVPLRYHPLCIETGREALESLLTGWNELSADKDEDAAKIFVNWALHHVPFMPFIAVLGNQVATGNKEDLQLLRNVTLIMKKVVQSNNALNKLYQACSRLLRIAELWRGTIESKDGEGGQIHSCQPETQLVTASHDQETSLRGNGSSMLSHGHPPLMASSVNDTTGPDFPTWQDTDIDMTNQDWDAMFNEFDLGLGAESAREMMPWFEQHMDGFNTSFG